jgi:predicted nucleic acid-binding protein
MPEAISNTSPLVYLFRIGALEWLPLLFTEIWVPSAVVAELREGRRLGYDVPDLGLHPWLEVVEPRATPSEWLALDLGPGELAAMALGLENPGRTVLLDDLLARRTAHAAGLTVWGTLKILLAAKERDLTPRIEPFVDQLALKGMWLSAGIRQRILALAGESPHTEPTG